MASVTAVEPTTCMTVDRQTFTQVLGPLQEKLEREANRRTTETENLKATQHITLSDLSEIGTLGVGTFGRVKLVEHKSTGQKFALKTMRKKQLIALKQVEHVMNEKTLLAQCNHPFLINLKGMCQWAPLHLSCLLARSLTVRVCTSSLSISGAFQDRVELYMVLELALGGELFSLLRDKIRFDENMTRFYAACVISAFIHLHDQSIAYRYC